MPKYEMEYTVKFEMQEIANPDNILTEENDGSRCFEGDDISEAIENLNSAWEEALEEKWVSVPDEFYDEDYECLNADLQIYKVTLMEDE